MAAPAAGVDPRTIGRGWIVVPGAFHGLGLHAREGVLPDPRWLQVLAELLG